MTTSKRSKRHEFDRAGCFRRILPSESGIESNEPAFAVDFKAKFLFELLLGNKKGQLMTISAFSKLSKAFSNLQRTRIELLYKRVMPTGNMDLDSYFTALQLLAESEVGCDYSTLVNQALSHFAPRN